MAKGKKTKRPVYYPYLVAIFAALFFLVTLVLATRYTHRSREVTPQTNKEESNRKSATETPSNSLPEEFPDDFPIYQSAELTDSWTTQSDNINGMSFVWKTKDTPQAVFGFFQKGLGVASYDYKVVSEEDSSYTISFEKDKAAGFVGITEAEGQTTISVTMGIKEQQTPVEE
jgi:hypothetical protein